MTKLNPEILCPDCYKRKLACQKGPFTYDIMIVCECDWTMPDYRNMHDSDLIYEFTNVFDLPPEMQRNLFKEMVFRLFSDRIFSHNQKIVKEKLER